MLSEPYADRSALFLDRDGVINVDRGYVYKKEDLEFIDGIFELVAAAARADYLVIVVTNQSGIGRGLYSEDVFHALMAWMKGEFASRGGRLDAVYFCPFHPEHGKGIYKRDSPERKPAPGMILRAAGEHGLNLAGSILVGDSVSDMQAGEAAGVGRIFLLGSASEKKGNGHMPPHVQRIKNPRELIPCLENKTIAKSIM